MTIPITNPLVNESDLYLLGTYYVPVPTEDQRYKSSVQSQSSFYLYCLQC